MNFMNFSQWTIIAQAAPPDGAGAGAGGGEILGMLLPLALMVGIFYFLLIRPERKRSKRAKEMLANIQVADEVVTSGGIIGRVMSIKEDTVLIETGSDRTRIRVLKSHIAENRTIHDA